ncbi:MAG: peptidoglycan DD-metalloendopeptidase family protein, partial [Deltaproteobacteria bacterium]|nr:peptidoglycan DD-metalloendopeptidase family protein [Deltaproteobacteria bacterium]
TDYQSYNRYAYVRNNPLKYVDPSGHSFWSWFKKIVGAFIGAVVGVVVGIATAGLGAIAAAALAGLAGGLVSGAVAGGLKGALMGGILGLFGGALGGGLSEVLTQIGGSRLGSFLIMGAVGLGLSVANDGWKGIITFGVGLLGAYAGGKMMGKNVFSFKKSGGEGLDYEYKKQKEYGFDYKSESNVGTNSGGSNGLVNPVGEGWTVNSDYGWRNHPISGTMKFHNGCDLVNMGGTTNNAPVYASANGIAHLTKMGGYGNQVMLKTDVGMDFFYAHLSSVSVADNLPVSAGQIVGYVGSTGSSTGPHLHFEVFVNGSTTDPTEHFRWR